MTRLEDKEEEERAAAVSCQTNCVVRSGSRYVREITVVEETKTVRHYLLDR